MEEFTIFSRWLSVVNFDIVESAQSFWSAFFAYMF